MTLGTGKRASRACLRCRQRKTKCNLDGVGEPKKQPCVSCHNTGSDCVLVKSRRGLVSGGKRHWRRRKANSKDSANAEGVNPSMIVPSPFSIVDEISPSIEELADEVADENPQMQIRNPSDALQILACSDEAQSSSHSSQNNFPSALSATHTAQDHSLGLVSSLAATRGGTNRIHGAQSSYHSISSTMALDGYELIRRGIVHPDTVSELIFIFSQKYHLYYPIVPHYMLGPSSLEKIKQADYFLLTVILTIASRDSVNHSLIHRYCWDHTQRLLLEVLLAQPWAHTQRTVQALLLLAEWLPHIQTNENVSDRLVNLFSEDRTSWSLIGLAVRQAYALRLDQASFRQANLVEPMQIEKEEQNRLVWTFVYLADRQISVRLGQSFWSRGPSLSSPFTANDYPSLRPISGVQDQDYAALLGATLELTQILYNAHVILYSTRERTQSMIQGGDYSSYLDDFIRTATTWRASWSNIQASEPLKGILFVMYEYICLYVNTFSFQAVITRQSVCPPFSRSQKGTNKEPLSNPFSRGIMSSPDGRYIFGAVSAATNLLRLLNDLDPQSVICYLPSKYYLYGVYAAVFLRKALDAGAIQSVGQCHEATGLALRFASIMGSAPSIETHICHKYSRMLRRLWQDKDADLITPQNRTQRSNTTSQNTSETVMEEPEAFSLLVNPPQNSASATETSRQNSPVDMLQGSKHMAFDFLANSSEIDHVTPDFLSIEGYFCNSFLPGVSEYSLDQQAAGSVGEEQGSQLNVLTEMDLGEREIQARLML